jgi:hypothetical protein
MNYSTEDAIRTLALSGLDFLILPDDVLIFRRRVQSVLDQALELEFSSQ